MNIGEIITVASGKDFMVLEILEINNDTYLYTVLLNKEEMQKYCFYHYLGI